jgi:cysteinyl-tRNA synthetase
MKIYNSLTKKVEDLTPINPPVVGMYTCGITAYDYAHIGHGRKYTMDDILRRTLNSFGYKVKHVQNVTDVGHLVSDSDAGEDKLEKGAKKQGKTVWEVAEFFTKNFYEAMDELNILTPDIICKATDNIPEQIALIEKIIKNGYGYDTPEAVYFDVSKFKNYTKLFGQNLEDKKTAVREEVEVGEFKKSPSDFALWFKRTGRFENHTMHWDSPWGDGFPGWHIECSAMSIKYLGDQFDIHTGGIDHLSIHHPNEIAQSEAGTGKHPFVKYWVHYEFLTVDGVKMSKSLGNFYTIEDILKKGFDPLALRYFYLTAHYKKPLNFTFDGLTSAQNALNKLRSQIQNLKNEEDRNVLSAEKLKQIDSFRQQFQDALNDDLNTAEALAVMWSMLKSNIPSLDKYDLALSFDEVLGLDLSVVNTKKEIPEKIKKLLKKREELRKAGKFADADAIRAELSKLGYTVNDAATKE